MHGCDNMIKRNQNIHGKCSHFYCGRCVAHNTSVDVLEEGCKSFSIFNKEEYRINKEAKA